MKIILVRHGQTDWNLEQRLQGSVDIPLNETGRSQAYELREKIKNINFSICYSSDLFRAAETAQIITGHRDSDAEPICYIRYDKRLRERSFGNFEGRKSSEFDFDFFADKSWDMELNLSDYGFEPIRDVYRRIKDFCDDALEKARIEFGDDAVILIAAHGGVSRVLNYVLLGGGENPDKNSEAWQKTRDFQLHNCGMVEYNI
jgi:broad specificity phosphatase PhoE